MLKGEKMSSVKSTVYARNSSSSSMVLISIICLAFIDWSVEILDALLDFIIFVLFKSRYGNERATHKQVVLVSNKLPP